MAMVLIEGPAGEPVSLAEARAQLGLAHGDDDALIAALIAAARRVIEARTGLLLMAQDWLCLADDWPQDGIMVLPVAPLAELVEIGVFGAEDEKAVIDPAHYIVDAAARPPCVVLRGGRHWPRPGRAANGIAIRLRAGFGAAADVPPPLRQAVLLLVAHFYAQRGEAPGGGLPLGLGPLLAPYRSVRL